MKQCWLQITSGRGPAECQLAVIKLAEHIVDRAIKSGIKAAVIEVQEGEKKGTALSALLSLSGDNIMLFCKEWVGSILWICPSPFRPNHKRKNWFVGVEVIKPLEVKDIRIAQKDIAVEVFRASGPGGQHVNTTNSAVRIKHKPTGLIVVSDAERSQIMNKKLALARLHEKLRQQQQEQKEENRKDQWILHNKLKLGSAAKVFEGTAFKEK